MENKQQLIAEKFDNILKDDFNLIFSPIIKAKINKLEEFPEKILDSSFDINKNFEFKEKEIETIVNIFGFVDDNKDDKNEINLLLTNFDETATNSSINTSKDQTKEILSILRPNRFYSSQNIVSARVGKENVSINKPKPKFSKFKSDHHIIPVRVLNPTYKVLDERGDILLKNFEF